MRLALFFWVLVVFCPATSVTPLNLDDLIKTADLVIQGKITGSSTELRQGHVWTLYEVEIQDLAKGSVTEGRIQIEQPGGKYGSLITQAASVRSFSLNQELALFLWKSPRAYQVLGFAQGSVSIRQNAEGQKVLVADEQNFALVGFRPNLSLMAVQGAKRTQLNEFLAGRRWEDLREYIKAGL